MMNEKPSYYAIIPAEVRYDERLSANEKLMYGEITCLAHTTRECWASNKYFAELYGRRKETISVWVRNLISCGYVSSKLIYKEGSKEVEKRILTLPRLITTPSREKSNYPLAINRKDNNTSENSTRTNINTKVANAPDEGKELSQSKQILLDQNGALFRAFWDAYPNKKNKAKVKLAHARALKKASGAEIISALHMQKASFDWTKDGGKYVPHPTTWLNGERWEDEIGGAFGGSGKQEVDLSEYL